MNSEAEAKAVHTVREEIAPELFACALEVTNAGALLGQEFSKIKGLNNRINKRLGRGESIRLELDELRRIFTNLKSSFDTINTASQDCTVMCSEAAEALAG